MGGNQRCVRTSGAANYLIRGHTGYMGKDGTVYQTFLSRANCSMPNYASYGAVITTNDETCSCYNGIRAKAAFVPPRTFTAIADTDRLTTPQAVNPANAPAKLNDSVLTSSWVPWVANTFFVENEQLGPATAGPVDLSIDIQRHLITATKAGETVWRYQADGRVHTMPTVVDTTAYVASTAGTVTALDLTTGAVLWQFLAGINHEQVVVNGQLESRWPVYNVLHKDGTLYFAAGRQVELDGGIKAWALNAEDGAIQQQFTYFMPISTLQAGGDRRQSGVTWRGNRKVASRVLLQSGMAFDALDRPCFINRHWAHGVVADYYGYWRDLMDRTKDRNDQGMPDFENPSQQLVPVDFSAWNGQTIHPLQVRFSEDIPKKNRKNIENYFKK